MTREEPRQRDWWLVGCAALAGALIAVDVTAFVSEDVVAAPAATPQVYTPTISASGRASKAAATYQVRVLAPRHLGRSPGIL